MIEKEPNFWYELNSFFVKIAIPAIVGISIKLATQIKKEKMTFIRVVISFTTGIGCAYFVYPFLNETKFMPLIIGVVSISGEKIMEFLIYKWNIDLFLTSLIEAIRQTIIKMIGK